MRLAEPFACIAVLCLAATPAAAQEVAFDIPAGRLSDAVSRLKDLRGLLDAACAEMRVRLEARTAAAG